MALRCGKKTQKSERHQGRNWGRNPSLLGDFLKTKRKKHSLARRGDSTTDRVEKSRERREGGRFNVSNYRP